MHESHLHYLYLDESSCDYNLPIPTLQMYSCGSLAPKMGRGSGGGCMDHKFRKPPEPWELADG